MRDLEDHFIELVGLLAFFLYMKYFLFKNSPFPEVILVVISAFVGLTGLLLFLRWLWLKRAGIFDVDKMTGVEFEDFLATYFRERGYRVNLTATKGDFGADLILEKSGRRIVVQAKRYRKNVGIKAVQEVVGAIAHYRADSGMVITNSYFTPSAKKLARSNRVKLVDRDRLIQMLQERQERRRTSHSRNAATTKSAPASVKAKPEEPQEQPQLCPRCNRELVVRESPYGSFLKCSGYPECTYTAPLKAQTR